MTETISAAADRLNISREQLRLWLLAANVYVPRSEGARSPMVLDSSVIERVVAERRQQHEEAERRRAEGEARATEAALPTLAERRAKVAERYRDDKTGACLTCQATAECSGYTKLICRWCEEAEEASEVERDDATEDE